MTQAIRVHKYGGPEVLAWEKIEVGEPGPGEVRVRVRASGVGSTDVIMRRGSYLYAPRIPFVPGYEVGEPQPGIRWRACGRQWWRHRVLKRLPAHCT